MPLAGGPYNNSPTTSNLIKVRFPSSTSGFAVGDSLIFSSWSVFPDGTNGEPSIGVQFLDAEGVKIDQVGVDFVVHTDDFHTNE